MSLTLSEIQNKVAFNINQFTGSTGSVHNSSGFPIGYIHQDKTRSIYERVTYGMIL